MGHALIHVEYVVEQGAAFGAHLEPAITEGIPLNDLKRGNSLRCRKFDAAHAKGCCVSEGQNPKVGTVRLAAAVLLH